MSFKLENFVAAPSMGLLNLAKKTDLLNIADHYALTSVKPFMLKHEIKNILIRFLVDEAILDPSALSSVLITQTDLQLRELEIQRQIQLGKLKLEQEERIRVEQLERKERIRVEQLEREERTQTEKLAIEKEKLEMEEREKEKERLIQRERLEMEEKEKERQYNLRMKELEMQVDENGVDHPVSYFSKKFNKHQKNYSTIEKECLSLILALQHFEVYLTSSPSPIVVFSDRNPSIFIHKMKTRIRGYSDGAYCYRNIILTSGISKEKTI